MLRFRCSRLGEIMTDPRAKKDLLSQTTMKYIRELYIYNEYGRRKDFSSKEMRKGIECEEDSIRLVNSVLGVFMTKNEEQFENEYITGTPDCLLSEAVVDVKTSWDLWTFTEAELSKAYEWQLRGYMYLTGRKIGYIAYCLVDTPEHFVQDELRSMSWREGFIDDTHPEYIKASDGIIRNMSFGDIPANRRVKFFRVDHSDDMIEAMIERIGNCRSYYKSLFEEPKIDVKLEDENAMEEGAVIEALIVSGVHSVTVEDIFGDNRFTPVVMAKHQHRALMCERLKVTEVSKVLGLTHASVNHSLKTHKAMLDTDNDYKNQWDEVKRKHDEWLGGAGS
jgi:hypothetical protein